MPTLTLYGKPGCHLCEDARAAVERVIGRRGTWRWSRSTSRSTRLLHSRYGERIPVLELDGETLFEFFVDESVLEERLDRVAP